MRKWTRQPPAGIPIDWTNPLTKGLVAAYIFDTPGKLRDVVGVHDSTSVGGSPDVVPSPIGLSTLFNGTDDDYTISDHPDLDASGDFSVVVGLTPSAASQNDEVIEKQSGNPLWQIRANTSDNKWYWMGRDTPGTLVTCTSASSQVADKYTQLIGVKSVADDRLVLYVDGVFDAEEPDTSDGDWSTSGNVLIAAGNTGNYQGTYHYVYIFQSALSDSDARKLWENPWQIFKPPKQFALADVPDDVRFLPVEKPWKKQPPVGTPIDWGNPLTKSMVACFVFNEESGNLRDRVKSRSITQGGTPDRITTPQGLAHAFGGTSDRYVVPNSSELNATGDFTVVVGFTNQEVGQNVEIVEKQLGNPMWQIYNSVTGNNLEFYGRDSAGTLITLDSVTTLDVGKYVQAAGVKSVANDRVYLYINGYLEDDVEDTSTGDWSNTADMLIADGSAAGMFNGYIHYLYIFQDAKDAEQIARIHENPWQIFKPQIIHAPADVALPDLATFERDW